MAGAWSVISDSETRSARQNDRHQRGRWWLKYLSEARAFPVITVHRSGQLYPKPLLKAFTELRLWPLLLQGWGGWGLDWLEGWGPMCHICPSQFLAPVPSVASSITLEWMNGLAGWVTVRNLSHASRLLNLLPFNHQSLNSCGQPGQVRVQGRLSYSLAQRNLHSRRRPHSCVGLRA